MNIVYAGLRYGSDGKDPSFAHLNFYLPLTSLKAHDVLAYYRLERIDEVGPQRASAEMLELVKTHKPDLFIIAGLSYELAQEDFMAMKNETTVAVALFDEDTDLYQRSLAWAHCFDWLIVFYPPAAVAYRSKNYNVIGVDWFVNTEYYRPIPKRSYRYDVSFVGSAKPERRKIVECLRRSGISVATFGQGWPQGMANFDDMIRIFNESKINLNFGIAKSIWRWQTPFRIFFSPAHNRFGARPDAQNAWGNLKTILNRLNPQSRARPFEIAACRAFVLTNKAPLFSPRKEGEEVVYFDGERSLVEKIRFYLDHDSERERIASNAYASTIAENSANRRLATILETIAQDRQPT